MLSLGYRIFPFEAFDENGELRIPDAVRFPPDVEQELGRVAANPLWSDLYRTMSPLQHHHKCFMAGVGFVNDRLQVALFKSATTVKDGEAQFWADNYHGTVEETLHSYAGRTHLIDPRWQSTIDKARSKLAPSQQDVEVADPTGIFQISDLRAPGSESPVQAVAVVPWLKFGLDLLAELVSKATVRTRVLSTIVWYPPQNVHADKTYAARWSPIHTDLQKGWLSGHRSAHLIWNPTGLPVTWRGTEIQWKGPGLDMPHEPVQWCQALRPLANCIGRPLATTEEGDAAAVSGVPTNPHDQPEQAHERSKTIRRE